MQDDNLELVKRGNPEAIAAWLTDSLQNEGIAVSVDREASRLSIGLYADPPLHSQQVIPRLGQWVKVIEDSSIRSINLFIYKTGELVPQWSDRFDRDLLVALEASGAVTSDQNQKSAEINQPDQPDQDDKQVDHFLVCGLGSLGQYCVLNLKKFALREFEVCITAIDRDHPADWEVENLEGLLKHLIIGDCRRDEILLKAGIQRCRAILVVTSDENVNIETAIAARRLNPKIRIVVRSARQSLNQLLKQQLRDFIAFEPTELPAPSFALAGLKAGILGFFNIENCRLQVVEEQVQPRDQRFDGFPAGLPTKKPFRLLSYRAADSQPPTTGNPNVPRRAFYHWQPETIVKPGDTIAYLEMCEPTPRNAKETSAFEAQLQHLWHSLREGMQGDWRGSLMRLWRWVNADPTRRMITLGVVTALFLWILGAVLLKMTNTAGINWQAAIFKSFILLLGGFGDTFGGLQNDPIPWWAQLICLLITIVSLLFVLGVLGLIADNVLSSRFEFRRKYPIPRQDHVVVVGFGRVGQRVATLLREFRQPLVAITEHLENLSSSLPIPMVVGDPIAQLSKVHLSKAKSVIVVTDDQMLNLEVALMAREAAYASDRRIGLVVRTYGQRFSDNLVDLLPDAKVLAAYALSAEAFVGAAFGETILGLFRLNEQTILVTEYRISIDDTLVGKLLSQVAHGYSVVPIFHQRGLPSTPNDFSEFLLPSSDRRLQAGDRLIVLSSINGLRRIERGEITPPKRWRLDAQKPLNREFLQDIGMDLARISGCSLQAAKDFADQLPGSIELDLYDHQAYRLQKHLEKQLPVTLTLQE